MLTQNTMFRTALVFTMHKVGSSTVMESFRDVHRLPERGYEENIEYLKDKGLENYEAVVTPVRDPIARNISYYFDQFGADIMTADVRPSMDAILLSFLTKIDHDYPLNWFENVFNPLFGIDAYKNGFAKLRGWSIIQERYLIIQTHRLEELLPDAFMKLFNERGTSYYRAQTRETRPYGQIYADFLKWVKLPEDYVSRMYESRYVKQFFLKKDVESWRKRWLKGL